MPEQAALPTNSADYFKVSEHGKASTKLVFIFGGWKFSSIVYQPLLRDLTKRGFKCISYVPSTDLIAVGTPYARIVAATKSAADDVAKRIATENQSGVVSFDCISMSFGTMFAMESAKNNPEIKKLLLCAPFGDFSEHVELWTGHTYFSKVLASQPTDLKESAEVLNQVGLHKNLDRLKQTQLLVCYSDNDSILHTSVVENFIRLLRAHQLHLQVIQVKGGHIPGIFRNLFVNKSYVDFLLDEK